MRTPGLGVVNSTAMMSPANRMSHTLQSLGSGGNPVIGLSGGASSAIGSARNSLYYNRQSVSQQQPVATPVPVKQTKSLFGGKSTSTRSSDSISNCTNGIGIAALGLEVGVKYTPTSEGEAYPSPITSDLLILCLNTLSNLLLPPFSLLPILQKCVLPFFDSDDTRVRKQAALTAATMLGRFIRDPSNVHLRGPTAVATEGILCCLLEMAVADTSGVVRLTVLQSLESEFDVFLKRTDNVNTLLFMLSDGVLEVKVTCIKILGRLSVLNPAAVLPSMRLVLLQLISEIRHTSDNRNKEDSVILLCTFIRAGVPLQKLIKSVIGTLIHSLPLTNDVRLATVKLEALGELCMVMGEEILPYLDDLMPVIVSNMHDNSVKLKQERAVKTLGQLVSATGYVVKPYLQFPLILPTFLDTLYKNAANTTPWSYRSEVLRTLGLLGSLEPHTYQRIREYIQTIEKNKLSVEKQMGAVVSVVGSGVVGAFADEDGIANPTPAINNTVDGSSAVTPAVGTVITQETKREITYDSILQEQDASLKPAHLFMFEQCTVRAMSTVKSNGAGESFAQENLKNNPTNEEYCPRVAVTALMRLLRDPSLAVHHSAVTQTIMTIFKGLGLKCVPLLDQIMPYLLQVIRTCGPGLRESILQQLSQLASIVRHNLIPYLPPLFEIIRLVSIAFLFEKH